MKPNKDLRILQHIVDYCVRARDTASYFDEGYAEFKENHVFMDAVALCVLQIGELAGILTDAFKTKYTGMPWRQIKALRNIVAHKYGTVDPEVLWEILQNDIPQLEQYCAEILNEQFDEEHDNEAYR